MEQLIAEMVMNHPALMSVVVVLGVFRMVFKPIMTAVQVYVEATPSTSDDEKFEEIKQSSVYKAIAWFADYLLSIKLPKAKKK